MIRNEEILNELLEISPVLAQIKPVNLFQVPEGYFVNVEREILFELNKQVYIFQQIGKQMPYNIPDGYFKELPDIILKTLNPISVLSNAYKKMPQHLDGQYFNSLPQQILNKIKEQEDSPKVISIKSKKKPIQWVQFVAAAVILSFTTLLVLNYYFGKAKFDVATRQGIEIAQKGTFEEELNKISDETIYNYLKSSGDESDMELLASNVDDYNLPGESELINNDNALDNWIKETDTNQ